MKLGVCVPYRNRELHLNEFIPKVGKFLRDRGIEFEMYFGHQVDDKLFNRGAMKNIAAEWAFKEGCDYIVWHDIDMIPESDADYSFPEKYPIHLATNISQMDYGLKYHEYFGGAVLFSKEQVEKTNGYSNNYWDWGMEDDDLFWRCHLEGLTNVEKSELPTYTKAFKFNGSSSKIRIPYRDEFRGLFSRSHSVEVLVKADQQPDKAPIHLIGDPNGFYIEYPIVRVPGEDYGISFNNSRAMTLQYWNTFSQHHYMWIKRYDGQWSWVKGDFDVFDKKSHFYLNGIEADSKAGHGTPSPLNFNGRLKNYIKQDIYLGYTPSFGDDSIHAYFKGEIADFIIRKEGEIIYQLTKDDSYEATDIEEVDTADMFIPNSIIPHRRPGRYRCLPHKDEGFVDGKWAKGETTAKNEKRYVLGMQQGTIDYKSDGMNSLKYKLEGVEQLTPWAKLINVSL